MQIIFIDQMNVQYRSLAVNILGSSVYWFFSAAKATLGVKAFGGNAIVSLDDHVDDDRWVSRQVRGLSMLKPIKNHFIVSGKLIFLGYFEDDRVYFDGLLLKLMMAI